MRDNFPAEVKEILAKRVGVKCSNPNCRRLTSGPSDSGKGITNVGVASHLTAASAGGPRFDASITEEERKSSDNGIWLCQICGKLIDDDPIRFSVDTLREWKRLAERATRLEIEAPLTRHSGLRDEDRVKFFAQCLDRAAFQDPIAQEGSIEDLDKALEDTIIALSTGCLRSRDGGILQVKEGKSFLEDPELRSKMDTIVDMIRAMRRRYLLAMEDNEICIGSEQSGRIYYCSYNNSFSEYMDQSRLEVIRIFNEAGKDFHVTVRAFPSRGRSKSL